MGFVTDPRLLQKTLFPDILRIKSKLSQFKAAVERTPVEVLTISQLE